MKPSGRLARFFMLGIIPFIFTIAFVVAVLMFLGVDVGAKIASGGQKLPLIGKYIASEDERILERKIEQLTAELEEKDELIDLLEQDLEAEREELDELQSEVQELTEKEEAEAEEAWIASYKEAAKNLEKMTASKAAPIISQMPPQEGLMMLHAMKSSARSQLLSKLPPDQAAVYTTMLKELLQFADNMPLAQAAGEVMTEYEEVFDETSVSREPADWALIFANMQPGNAAAILQEMDEGNALNILRELEVADRAAILASMDAAKASDLSQRLISVN